MEKIFLRYRIILNDTKDAQSDAIRTQDNYANQLKRMKAAVTNLQVEIGEKLLPVMVGLLKTVMKLVDVFRNMSTETIRVRLNQVRIVLAIGAFLVIVPKITVAIITLVKAYRALAIGQAIVQGLAGPAGWAALAAGAAIAAAAVYALNLAFENTISKMKTLSEETGKFKASSEQLKVTMDDIRESMRGPALTSTGFADPGLPEMVKLRKQLYEMGLSKRKLSELQLQRETGLGAVGLGAPTFKRMFAIYDKIEAKQKSLDLAKAGQDLFTQMMSPLEKYEAKLTQFDTLLKANKITWDTYGRAIRAARGELEGTGGSFAGPGGAKVIREAFVSVSGLATGTKDPALSRMDQQLSETKKTNDLLMQIRNEGGLS